MHTPVIQPSCTCRYANIRVHWTTPVIHARPTTSANSMIPRFTPISLIFGGAVQLHSGKIATSNLPPLTYMCYILWSASMHNVKLSFAKKPVSSLDVHVCEGVRWDEQAQRKSGTDRRGDAACRSSLHRSEKKEKKSRQVFARCSGAPHTSCILCLELMWCWVATG